MHVSRDIDVGKFRNGLHAALMCGSLVGSALLSGCPQPAPVEPSQPEAVVEEPQPEEAAAEEMGVPDCDAYLDLYRRCEARLRPAIAAGEMRSYEAEAGWLRYMATTSERPAMPAACRSMLGDLRTRCGPP